MITLITVLGRTYAIQYVDLDDTYGEHDQVDKVIRIHHSLSEEDRRATVVHEVIHAILFESGLGQLLDGDLEEALCRAIEHGLMGSGLIKESIDPDDNDDGKQLL